jgi:hypothetical protein
MSRTSSLSATIALALVLPAVAAAAPQTAPPPSRATLAREYGKLPLGWEANRGQADPQIKFLGHGPGYALFLTRYGAALILGRNQVRTTRRTPRSLPREQEKILTLSMRLVGSNPARLEPLDRLPGHANYFLGNDPRRWLTGVPLYARVRYRGAYPGVDLVFHESAARQLEYDLVLSPGADPDSIRLRFDGAAVDLRDGRLLLRTPLGVLSEPAPIAFQPSGVQQKLIAVRYVRRGPQEIGFQLGPHDASLSVTIDPILAYSTFLGGNSTDVGSGIAIDSSGNAYVTGTTFSTDFAGCSTHVALLCTNAPIGSGDAFVAKINASGSALSYVTYLGGSSIDRAFAIAIDGSGNAYITGFTFSSNFPQMNGLTNTVGSLNAFVTKLNSSGSIAYSTYLDGSSESLGLGIATDGSANAYVTGTTSSSDFPVVGQLSSPCAPSAFVTKLNTNNSGSSSLVYSTCLGTGTNEVDGNGIAVDGSQNAYITGTSFASDLLTANGFSGGCADGGSDAFAARLDTTKTGSSALLFLTCLGSGNFSPLGDAGSMDFGYGIAVDGSANAYVTGQTFSSDFPTTASEAQTTCGTEGDAFVAKLNTSVQPPDSLIYSTCLGGNAGDDFGSGIAADSFGNAYVVGETDSLNQLTDNFPTTSNALQANYGGGFSDGFIAQINTTFSGPSSLVFSTYFGGADTDTATAIAFDGQSNAVVTGETASTDFPLQNALYSSLAGGVDAFVAKITFSIPFSQFSAKLAIVSGPPPGFNLNSSFTLGPGGSIHPLTDPVTLQVGPPATGYSVTIPPGSFQLVGNGMHYVFSGTIGGATLSINLSPVSATSYTFRASVTGPNLTALTNSVSVTLTIGNHTGTTQVTASFQ